MYQISYEKYKKDETKLSLNQYYVIEKSVPCCAGATFLSKKCYNNSEEIILPKSTLTSNVEKVKH